MNKFKALVLCIVLFIVIYLTFTVLFVMTDISNDIVWSKVFMASNYFVTTLLTFTIGYIIVKDVYVKLIGVLLIGLIIINILKMIGSAEFSFAHTALLFAFIFILVKEAK